MGCGLKCLAVCGLVGFAATNANAITIVSNLDGFGARDYVSRAMADVSLSTFQNYSILAYVSTIPPAYVSQGAGCLTDAAQCAATMTSGASVSADAFAGLAPWRGIDGLTTYGTLDNAGSSVPEPGTLALLGLALAGFGLSRRRKAH